MRAERLGPSAAHTAETERGTVPTALQPPHVLAAEVARVLAAMTYEERIRAYRSGALTAHELSVGAGWFPEEMPLLNGEFEWIAIDLE